MNRFLLFSSLFLMSFYPLEVQAKSFKDLCLQVPECATVQTKCKNNEKCYKKEFTRTKSNLKKMKIIGGDSSINPNNKKFKNLFKKK